MKVAANASELPQMLPGLLKLQPFKVCPPHGTRSETLGTSTRRDLHLLCYQASHGDAPLASLDELLRRSVYEPAGSRMSSPILLACMDTSLNHKKRRKGLSNKKTTPLVNCANRWATHVI